MQQSFGDFDYAECLSWLEGQGNPLPRLKGLIPWEPFRGDFKGLYKQEGQEKRKGGRTPTDCIVMPGLWCCRTCTSFRTIRRSIRSATA